MFLCSVCLPLTTYLNLPNFSELQDQLTRLIIRILSQHPDLHYYQGYHDVAITFLLVVGEEMAFNILEKLSNGPWLREFMEPTMEKTTYLLNYMYPLVRMFGNFWTLSFF